MFLSGRVSTDPVLAGEYDLSVSVWEPGDHQRKNHTRVSPSALLSDLLFIIKFCSDNKRK